MPNKQRRLIIFAPGWSGLPPKRFNPLLQRLNKGFDIVSLKYLDNGFDSIPELAIPISRQLNQLRSAYEHITWIGHSMGGLIPWNAAIHSKIDAFISLGTPWEGSLLASLAPWSKSATQMKWHSPFVSGWKNFAEQWSGPKLSVCGSWDFIVPDNPHLDSATKVDIPYCSHTGLIISQRVAQEIWAYLTYSIFKETGLEDEQGYMSYFRSRFIKEQ